MTAAHQLVIHLIAASPAITVLGRGQPLKILFKSYKSLNAGSGPKRINPDDKRHSLPSIMKDISGPLPEFSKT